MADSLTVDSLPVNIFACAVLALLSIVDWKTQRVPNFITLPALAALAAWRVSRGEEIVFLYWLAAFSLYIFHIASAGDVKVIMIELTLWPSMTFVIVMGITVAVIGTTVSIARYRGVRPFLAALQASGARLISGRPPSETELRFYGSPQVFLYAASAVVYLAMFYAISGVAGG
jgi:hypothetical protein